MPPAGALPGEAYLNSLPARRREAKPEERQSPKDSTARMDALIRDAVERSVARRVDAYLGMEGVGREGAREKEERPLKRERENGRR